MNLRDMFARTACACDACVECCKEQPGPLAPGDLERIAAHLGISAEYARVYFWASPGAVVADSRAGQLRTIGTITPRMEAGRCIFLDAHDRCRVHPVAPFGCACFDTHMGTAQWRRRSSILHAAIERDAGYQAERAALSPATSWRPRT